METIINKDETQIWYITGSTSGTGLGLARALLSRGHKVTGTTRDINKLSSLDIFKNPNFLGLQVNLVDPKSVKDSIDKTIQHFGSLTHVINNAGYNIFSSIEEGTEKEIRDLFDALYFGPLNVIQSALPYLRSKNDGYIFNISSFAAIVNFPFSANYSAVKAALSVMTEGLASELKPFNIKVSNIVLGFFDTGFKDAAGYTKNLMPNVYETEKTIQHIVDTYIATAPVGDVKKFTDIIIEQSTQPTLPSNLFIGPPDNFIGAEAKFKQLSDQLLSQKERNSNVVKEN